MGMSAGFVLQNTHTHDTTQSRGREREKDNKQQEPSPTGKRTTKSTTESAREVCTVAGVRFI
jgi:hypothetical protein